MDQLVQNVLLYIAEQHQLQDNDLYENQYDDVMNNSNSKTTNFNNNKTMSKIYLTPRQRLILKLIWRCHEQPQLQDNDLYENQYDDVMNNSNSNSTNFNNNKTMSKIYLTPRQWPL